MDFIELSDGTLLNPAGILRLWPGSRANRIDYIDGSHQTLSPDDGETVREALRAKRKKQTKENKSAR